MKIVLQDGIKDCGICCLLSIIRFYGGEVSKEYLRELTNTTKDGVTLYNLINAAKKIGFDAEGLSGNIKDINVNNLPCIAHVNINKKFKHFVVIYKINKDKHQITIMDPAKGKKTISFSEFNLLSSNNYLFITPKRKLPIYKKKNIIYRVVYTLITTNKKKGIIVFILTINYFILTIILSFHFKYLLEYSINYQISTVIIKISILISVVYILKNIICYLRNTLLNKWNSIFDISIYENTYRQILLLPYLYFKNRTTGEVVSRFKDLNTVREYLTTFFCTFTTDFISMIIFLIIMINYNIKLTIIINIHILLIIIYILITNKLKKRLLKKVHRNEDIVNSYLIQGISNVDTIKGSHLEKRFIDKFSINYKLFQESIYSYNNLIEIELLIKTLINDFIYVFIFGIGSYLVIKGKITLSNLIVYQTIINYYLKSTLNIVNIVSSYNTFKISLDRVEELYMLDEENFKNNFFYLPYNLNGNIEINNLNYKVGSKIIFNNLNLKINQGEKILLSGESGCGKSTLVKMLLRYIETEFNTIKISDIDINHYHLQNIRSNITYVTSNEYLFNDTLKNNICLYKEYKEEEIEEVCKICLVDDIIKNKESYLDTIIEENGFDLSNGERQRIILARSLLKKTNIYIFDEALAQIDINREKKILVSIFNYLKHKTIIIISHRFNNKKLFDRVLKLEKGKINENKKV